MDAFIGEIRLFAGNYAPQDWALCDGSLLRIADYNTLYALLGTTYGGDGATTFALPDLRGRVPVSFGQLTGGSIYVQGQKLGEETHTLTEGELAAHSHLLMGANAAGTLDLPGGNLLANAAAYCTAPTDGTVAAMNNNSLSSAGGSLAHDNVMPFMVLNYIICINNGIFPDRP